MISAPAFKYSSCIELITAGLVIDSKSLLPFKSQSWSLNLSPLKSSSSKENLWIMVPMAPSRTKILFFKISSIISIIWLIKKRVSGNWFEFLSSSSILVEWELAPSNKGCQDIIGPIPPSFLISYLQI